MYFNNKFIYEADPENANAGGTDVIELPAEVKAQLQELQELREYKNSILSKEPDKTPEQLAKDVEVEKVNFRKFAVERDIMKNGDFDALETLKSKADRDLVFEDFAKEWESDNSDVDPEDKEALLKEAFESQYHLNSENKTLKTRGEKMLAKEAAEKRTPYESSYKTAQEQYGLEKSIAAKVPDFNKFIDNIIKENTPDKITLFKTKEGEEEIPVEVELTKEQKTEIDKLFKTPKVFQAFSSAKQEDLVEIQKSIVKKINGFIKINNFDVVAQKSFEAGKGIGTKSGSDIGANAPFALKQTVDKAGEQKEMSVEESNLKIAEARQRSRRR